MLVYSVVVTTTRTREMTYDEFRIWLGPPCVMRMDLQRYGHHLAEYGIKRLEYVRCEYGLFCVEVVDKVPRDCVVLAGEKNSCTWHLPSGKIYYFTPTESSLQCHLDGLNDNTVT